MAIEIDPVCGMQVDTETTDLKYEHDGTTYWFLQPRPHARLPRRPGEVPRPGLQALDVKAGARSRDKPQAPASRLRGDGDGPGTPRQGRPSKMSGSRDSRTESHMSVRRVAFRTLVSLLALAVVALAAQAGQRWWP